MAVSWRLPKIVSKILESIPAINVLLNALAKMDYSGTEDVPNGAVRLAPFSGGYQMQMYNGTSWVSVGKLIHDADSVDGKSANTGTAANTLPVRNSSGKLPGDITGNAATADTADTLSKTLPISLGGTGATTASGARSNLGVPPTSHASTATTYGISSATRYGHAMAASDAPAQDTDSGSVGSDVSHFARGDHAHKKVLGTSSVYGQVKLTDSVSSTSAASSHIGASAKAVKTAYDKAVEAATTEMTGATSSAAGSAGLVPAPAKGAQNRPLRGDGTWATTLTCNITGNCSGSSGSCTGNAATATKATGDESGNNIKSSYAASLSISGSTVTLKNKNGGVLSTQNIGGGAAAKAYVTTVWHSGRSWYRKWSDGFIEQGGFIEDESVQTKTISLPTSFSGSDYSVFVNVECDRISQSPSLRYITAKTASTFTIYMFTGSSDNNVVWHACGY